MPSAIWKGTSSLVPQIRSGSLKLADRSTSMDVYRGSNAACMAAILSRGTFGSGSRLGWVVTSATVDTVDKGGISELVINWEAGGASAWPPLPVDEFDLQPVELYPRIERAGLFANIATKTLAYAYAAVQGATPMARQAAADAVTGLSDTTQRTLGLALITKLRKGEETWYMAGWRYVWTAYSYTIPTTTLGGIIQSPLGPLYGYFSGSISFLRLADALQSAGVNGSCFKIMRTWLGGPSGYWDSDIYS